MAARLYQRSAITTDGSRRYGAVAWVVERDLPGGVIEFARFGSREEAEAELGREAVVVGRGDPPDAERLFGDPDYLVRVATSDIAAYQNLRDAKLATLPGVQRLTSTIVMKCVVDERPFPLSRQQTRAPRRR